MLKKKRILNNRCNILTKRVSSIKVICPRICPKFGGHIKAGYLFKGKEQLIIMKK